MEGTESKTEAADITTNAVRPVKKQKKVTRSLHDILGGDYLSKDRVIRNMPFLFYVAFLVLIYIANTYYAEKTFKKIETTKTELKELRYQYLTTKSTLMFYSKQTEIAKRAMRLGIRETTLPPFKIYYSNNSGEKKD